MEGVAGRSLVSIAAFCAAAALLWAGCKQTPAFRCDSAAQCIDGAQNGRCEESGYCSFYDRACDSSWRYGDFSGRLTGTCVDDPANGKPLFASDIEAGAFHSCAIDPSGTVFCWGNNSFGQLGTGDREHRARPTEVALPAAARTLTLADAHSCAALADGGAVYCWGDGSRGQLGVSGVSESLLPEPLGLENVTDMVSATNEGPFGLPNAHTCAVDGDGAVFCWGSNDYGQVGDETTEDRLRPHLVPGLPPIDQVSAGKGFVCARSRDGDVWCWGRGNNGVLGQGNEENSLRAVAVPISKVVEIESTTYGTCARNEDDRVLCWGLNDSHALAMGPDRGGMTFSTPTESLASGELTLAFENGCGIDDSGEMLCWGDGDWGLFGVDRDVARVPERLELPLPVVDVAVGNTHVCAVTESREVYCLGAFGEGYLGDGRTSTLVEPVKVQGGTAHAAISSSSGCVVTNSGDNACWGAPGDVLGTKDDNRWHSWVSTDIRESGPLTATSVAPHSACGIGASGALYCWGNGDEGALGTGSEEDSDFPIAVQGLPDPGTAPVLQVAVGDRFACAAVSDGRVFCWGEPDDFRLGAARDQPATSATAVTGISAATGIFVSQAGGDSRRGDAHVCVVQNDTDPLICWGANKWGQLGLGSQSDEELPGAVDNPCESAPIAVALGSEHSCLLCEVGGDVFCWGRNEFGQLGLGDTRPRSRPRRVTGLGPATAIAAAGKHTCALAGEQLYCWGANGAGQLGTPPSPPALSPMKVETAGTLGTVEAVHLGAPPWPRSTFFDDQGSTCVIAGGDLYCWGSNYNAQCARVDLAVSADVARVELE